MRTLLFFLFSIPLFSQSYKDGISVVQFSAEFTKGEELSLKSFKDYNTETFYIESNSVLFQANRIKYLPTICLFRDGELITKIEAGISLKLPDNTIEKLLEEIDNILQNQF